MKRVISFLLAVLLLSTLIVPAYAHYAIPDGMSLEEASKDPKYWWQGSVPEGNFSIHPAGGSSVGEAACSWFATSFCLVKMGIMDPKTENPITLIKWAQERPDERIWSGFHAPFHDVSILPQKYPGLEMIYCDDMRGSTDYGALKTYIKGKMAEKWFIALCVGQPGGGAHWVAVDGFDSSGELIIADSAYACWDEPKKYSDPGNYGPNGTYSENQIVHVALFKKDGCDPNNCASIYGGKFEAENGGELTAEEQAEFDKICAENDLRGMSGILESNVINSQEKLELADRRYLSQENITQIENIKDIRNAGKLTVVNVVSIALKGIALVLLAYATLLFLAVILDRVNPLTNINILPLVTFGRLKLNLESDISPELHQQGHQSMRAIIGMIIVLYVVGILFVSNLPLYLIYSIIS